MLAISIESIMIKKYSLKALQYAINKALALDDHSLAKLTALQGRIVNLIIEPLGIDFFICFDNQQMLLLDDVVGTPDTTIYSSPLGLIYLSLLPASQIRSLFNDKIRLSGDIELGQQVKKLLDELDIDWQGYLAHFTGDIVAYQLGSLIKQGHAFQQRFSQSMCEHTTDYLQDEWRFFPTREEVEDFFHDVDQLSIDSERIHAQFKLLLGFYEIN
jgi:ubiquinone biosynthesis protein UbiJ